MATPPNNQLQTMLQTAVQSVQWTYSLFWQLCPQQGILVWGDGYYNGEIKTRKTVQPVEVSTEEASLQRSEQLRELYDYLSAGETNQPAQRPSGALSPEDLTESEWFYLMCVSFSYPPGVGLPGKAYAKQQHVWLTGTNEVDSKVFSRAILAKSAHVQTVVCIPVLHGVVELGTTAKVEQDLEFVKRVKSFFIDHNQPLPEKPALSGHSTSNNVISPQIWTTYTARESPANAYQIDEEDEDNKEPEDDDDEEEEEDDDDDAEGGGGGAESDSEAETARNSMLSSVQNPQTVAQEAMVLGAHAEAEPSELMQLDLSEDIMLWSPDNGSNNLDSDFHLIAVNPAKSSYRDESTPRWPDSQLQNPLSNSTLHLQAPGTPGLEELTQEDTHYSHTVSTILHHQSTRWSDPSSPSAYPISSTQSAFSTWTTNHHHLVTSDQWILKYILFTVPYLHQTAAKSRYSAASIRKGTPQDELSPNHVLAERRRREKLNERFIILRSLIPIVTKMDKASILGDTIEHVKQLRKKIEELEARARHVEIDQQMKTSSKGGRADKRKMRIVEGSRGGNPKAVETPPRTVVGEAVQVEVSIIESDALVEMEYPYREGLLLDVMKKLRELRVEITTVQSSLNDSGICAAEMRAKVKENANGKKLSIMEVKRAINQIIPLY